MVKKEFQKLKEFTKKETMVSIIEEKEKSKKKMFEEKFQREMQKIMNSQENVELLIQESNNEEIHVEEKFEMKPNLLRKLSISSEEESQQEEEERESESNDSFRSRRNEGEEENSEVSERENSEKNFSKKIVKDFI